MRMDAGPRHGPDRRRRARCRSTGAETAPELEARPRRPRRRPAGPVAGAVAARRARRPTPQPADGVTLTRPLRREDGRLDPSLPAADLERRVRAYLPWPGTFLEADGERLVVGAASVAASRPDDVPGRLVRDGDLPAFTTADGRLVLERVTPPGRRPMSGADYLRGRAGLPPDRRSPRLRRHGLRPCQNRWRWRMTPRPPRRSPVRGSAASRPRTSRPGSPSAATRPTARARSSTPPGAARPPGSRRS